jgi:hypothetical protein
MIAYKVGPQSTVRQKMSLRGRQDVRVLTPHALQSDDDLFLLDSLSGNVKVMNGDLVREAEPL